MGIVTRSDFMTSLKMLVWIAVLGCISVAGGFGVTATDMQHDRCEHDNCKHGCVNDDGSCDIHSNQVDKNEWDAGQMFDFCAGRDACDSNGFYRELPRCQDNCKHGCVNDDGSCEIYSDRVDTYKWDSGKMFDLCAGRDACDTQGRSRKVSWCHDNCKHGCVSNDGSCEIYSDRVDILEWDNGKMFDQCAGRDACDTQGRNRKLPRCHDNCKHGCINKDGSCEIYLDQVVSQEWDGGQMFASCAGRDACDTYGFLREMRTGPFGCFWATRGSTGDCECIDPSDACFTGGGCVRKTSCEGIGPGGCVFVRHSASQKLKNAKALLYELFELHQLPLLNSTGVRETIETWNQKGTNKYSLTQECVLSIAWNEQACTPFSGVYEATDFRDMIEEFAPFDLAGFIDDTTIIIKTKLAEHGIGEDDFFYELMETDLLKQGAYYAARYLGKGDYFETIETTAEPHTDVMCDCVDPSDKCLQDGMRSCYLNSGCVVSEDEDLPGPTFEQYPFSDFSSGAEACDFCFGVKPKVDPWIFCVCYAYPIQSLHTMFCSMEPMSAEYVASKNGCRCKANDAENNGQTTCSSFV